MAHTDADVTRVYKCLGLTEKIMNVFQVLHVDGHVGGYPIKFLEQIVRLSKCLKKKRELIGSLRDLNAQGEKKKSYGDQINEDFQRRYASNVLELSQVNRDLNEHLKNIQEFTQEVRIFNIFKKKLTLPNENSKKANGFNVGKK